MKPIYYTKPSITDLEVNYAKDAAENGWGPDCYAYIERFEQAFRDFVGSKFAISTSSCTGALHMGLSAIGIKPGDEIIVADTNWIASVAPIVHLGAKPVFVDIDPETWCVEPTEVQKAITSKTKAILAVHLYGNFCEIDRLKEIAKKYKLTLIEDAAEAIGSYWVDKHAGSLAEFGTFSFHGTKTITTGEGGMFVTDNEDLYEKVLTLSNHGRSRKQTKQFWPDLVGFKYKISNVQAAIGLAQTERISDLVDRKREIFNYYSNSLSKIKGIKMNNQPYKAINGYWMPNIVLDEALNLTTDKLITEFKNQNIDARVFFSPLSSLPMFTDKQENKVSWNIFNRAINLPSYHDLTFTEQDKVINTIKSFVSV